MGHQNEKAGNRQEESQDFSGLEDFRKQRGSSKNSLEPVGEDSAAKASPPGSEEGTTPTGDADESTDEIELKSSFSRRKSRMSQSLHSLTEKSMELMFDLEDKDGNERKIDWKLFVALSLGDMFHNLVDGIFIGTAYLLCDHSVALTIAAATIAHELPQEIADYFLLVHQCHMKRPFALFLNFLVGISIMLGGIIVLAVPGTPSIRT